MKKALIVTTVSGFVPQFESNNVRILQNMGYEIHYATNYHNVSYGTDNHRLDGTGIVRHQVDFTRSPYNLKRNKIAYEQLKELLTKEEFIILHCHTPVGGVLARLAARACKKKDLKVIYTAHGFHFFKGAPWKYWLLFYPVERFLAGSTDVLITINEEDYARAKKFCIHKKTRVERVPGVGIDLDFWNGKDLAPGEKESIRKRVRDTLVIPDNSTALISVGELIPRKNHEEVIRALYKEKKNGKSFRYFICGHGVLQEYLQKLIEELGLQEEVTLLGYCDKEKLREYLYGMDLFVFPSKQEGLPVALMEAIATGIEVKVSNIRGNQELVDNRNQISQYDIKEVQKQMAEIYSYVEGVGHKL